MPRAKPIEKPVPIIHPKLAAKKFSIPEREDWMLMSLEDAHAMVQQLCQCYQEGAQILNQRTYDKQRETGVYKCMVCGQKKPIVIDNHPNYVWRDDRPDPMTRIYQSKFICSQQCYFRGSNQGRLTNAKVPADVHK